MVCAGPTCVFFFFFQFNIQPLVVLCQKTTCIYGTSNLIILHSNVQKARVGRGKRAGIIVFAN